MGMCCACGRACQRASNSQRMFQFFVWSRRMWCVWQTTGSRRKKTTWNERMDPVMALYRPIPIVVSPVFSFRFLFRASSTNTLHADVESVIVAERWIGTRKHETKKQIVFGGPRPMWEHPGTCKTLFTDWLLGGECKLATFWTLWRRTYFRFHIVDSPSTAATQVHGNPRTNKNGDDNTQHRVVRDGSNKKLLFPFESEYRRVWQSIVSTLMALVSDCLRSMHSRSKHV